MHQLVIFTRNEDLPTRLPRDERPVSMKELSLTKVYDFEFKYGQKTACDLNEDLSVIDRSMMQSSKRNRYRFKKQRKQCPCFSFVPTLEVIQENELFETQLKGQVKFRQDKDLASIHKERALGCGDSLLENGRVYHRVRNKKRSRILTGGREINKEHDLMDRSPANSKLPEVPLMATG